MYHSKDKNGPMKNAINILNQLMLVGIKSLHFLKIQN
jgi:hypothetical protein